MEEIRGLLSNYYGGLWIQKNGRKYYWIIENHSTDFDEINEWDQIPKSLYDELKKLNVKS